ncbi:MAG: HPr(Ser) kinase/phosphatase [candidate division WOR-3 bacterium]
MAIKYKEITVKTFVEEKQEDFRLEVLAGARYLEKKKIVTPDINRPGMALAGFTGIFLAERIQIIGRTEISYLKTQSEATAIQAIKRIFAFQPPCIIVTKRVKVPKFFLEAAETSQVPVIYTRFDTTHFIHRISAYLDYRLAPETYLHGDLVDVYGVGLLIVGESGIGKSECALDLVDRGHRLIADDLVKILRRGEGILMGYSAAKTPALQHHIEIRGVGIVDIYNIYGIRSVRVQKRVEILVELVRWTKRLTYDRIGIEDEFAEILGVKIPRIRVPVIPGKNLALVCEVIAKNHIAKILGYHPAKLFNQELLKVMKQQPKIDPFITDDLE